MKYKKISLSIFGAIALFLGCTSSQLNTNESKINELVTKWNKAHNEQNIGIFDELYANEVQFYQKKLSKNKCLEEKLNLFKKNSDFYQEINKAIELEKLPNNQYKTSFVKSVRMKQKVTDYPSYLIFDDKGKIIAESDMITEAAGNTSKEVNVAQTTLKDYGKPFIKGANNGITVDYQQASEGAVYRPIFPTSVIAPTKIQVFFNQTSLDLKVEYQNGQRVRLPYKFELGYDKSDPEMSVEKPSNKYFIGQYDFDSDGIDEIIFAVQDNAVTESGASVSIIKYFPPINDNNANRQENWALIGVFSANTLGAAEGVIKDKSIRFDRGLRGFYYEWTCVKGRFIDTGDY